MCTDSSTGFARGWGFRTCEAEVRAAMNLDPSVRLSLANAVTRALEEAVAGCSVGLRGSLARGTSDPYSDIDIFWELPDSLFQGAIDDLPEILASLGPIESIRADPLLQNSDKRQLLFVQFAEVPLYWRVDIEIFAVSIGRDDAYDLDNLDARGDRWSLTHSAIANGVAALKSLLRGDAERACESLRNAYARIDQPTPDGSALDQIFALAEIVGRLDLEKAELVRRLQLHCDAARAALENEPLSRC
jgi:predicted nucleotidyltransferase